MIRVLTFDLHRNDLHDNFGIHMVSKSYGTYINHVLKRSTAEKVGLRLDDKILVIDGEVLQPDTSIHHVSKLLNASTDVHMLVERQTKHERPFLKKIEPNSKQRRTSGGDTSSTHQYPIVRDRPSTRQTERQNQSANPISAISNAQLMSYPTVLPNMGVPMVDIHGDAEMGSEELGNGQQSIHITPSSPVQSVSDAAISDDDGSDAEMSNLTSRLSDRILESSLGGPVRKPADYVSNREAILREEELLRGMRDNNERMKQLRMRTREGRNSFVGVDDDDEQRQKSILDVDPTVRSMLGWVRAVNNGSSFY